MLPKVVPLLVTDDIERAASSAAAETARQLALALSVLAPFAQGSGSVNSVNQELQSLAGQNYDSLLTVGRGVDNTVIARIGAAYQSVPNKGWLARLNGDITTRALVGQNYDIATVVLVPKAYFKRGLMQDTSLKVNVYTEFRNARDGTLLSDRPRDVAVSLFDRALTETVLSVKKWPWYYQDWAQQSVDEKYQTASAFAGYVEEDDFSSFVNTLEKDCRGEAPPRPGSPPQDANTGNRGPAPDQHPLEHIARGQAVAASGCPNGDFTAADARNLWTRLSALLPDSSFNTAIVRLPFVQELDIPDQVIALLDDGKSGMQAQVRTNATEIGANIVATVNLFGAAPPDPAAAKGAPSKCTAQPTSLLSKSAAFDQTTGILTFQFPSAAASGITDIGKCTPTKPGDATMASLNALELSRPSCDLDSLPGREVRGSNCTQLVDASAKNGSHTAMNPLPLNISYVLASGTAGPAPGFTFTSGTKQVVEVNSNGEVIVAFTKWGKAEATALVTVDGATLLGAAATTAADLPAAGQLSLSKNQVSVPTGSGALTLQLTNSCPRRSGDGTGARQVGERLAHRYDIHSSRGRTDVSQSAISLRCSPNKEREVSTCPRKPSLIMKQVQPYRTPTTGRVTSALGTRPHRNAYGGVPPRPPNPRPRPAPAPQSPATPTPAEPLPAELPEDPRPAPAPDPHPL